MKPINLLLLRLLLFFSGQIQGWELKAVGGNPEGLDQCVVRVTGVGISSRIECSSRITSAWGSTEVIQIFLPTGKESNISFPVEKRPENCAILLFDPLNNIIATCYLDGEVNCRGITLTVKNPKTSNSGLFCLKMTVDKHNDNVRCCNVTFQDPVSPVRLMVDVISDSSCKFNATCSTEDDEINGTFSCDNETCRLVGGERSKVTKSGASLSLYQSNGSIICNHSNQVNWTQNKKEIQQCLRSEGSTVQTLSVAAIVSVAGGLVAAIAGCVLCYCKKRKRACFAQRQTQSSNSQMPEPPQVNGDLHVTSESNHLMEENTKESSV